MPIIIETNTLSSTDVNSSGVFTKAIVDEGLILYYDAANYYSYPGSGTTWYNMVGSGSDLTLLDGLTTATIGGRTAMNFNVNGKYAGANGIPVVFGTKSATFEVWLYPGASELTAGDRGTVILINGGSAQYMSWTKDNGYLSSYWYSHSPEGYHETVGSTSRNTWNHWVASWDYNSGRIFQYKNGLTAGNTATQGDSTPGQNLTIGRESEGRQFSGGIAVVRIYNRALSADEVFQNYTSEKNRFGI
jgi:hypothetical protein